MNADFSYIKGYVYGIAAAFLATLFTILNALYVNKVESEHITSLEMLGGFLFVSIYFDSKDWLYPFNLVLLLVTR